MSIIEPLWPLPVFGTDEVLKIWDRNLLAEIFRQATGRDAAEFIDGQIFMASDVPVLFLAGSDPWDADYVRLFHVPLTLCDTMPAELRDCWERHRTEELASADWRQILHLMTAPSA